MTPEELIRMVAANRHADGKAASPDEAMAEAERVIEAARVHAEAIAGKLYQSLLSTGAPVEWRMIMALQLLIRTLGDCSPDERREIADHVAASVLAARPH